MQIPLQVCFYCFISSGITWSGKLHQQYSIPPEQMLSHQNKHCNITKLPVTLLGALGKHAFTYICEDKLWYYLLRPHLLFWVTLSYYTLISFYLQVAEMSQLFSASYSSPYIHCLYFKKTRIILILFNVTEPQWPLRCSDHFHYAYLMDPTAQSSN